MSHQEIARLSLALFCALRGIGTLTIDLNSSQATNPQWPGYARFHLVWQATTYAILSLLEVALIFMAGPFQKQRFYLAAILAAIPMLGFSIALLARKIYGGTLSLHTQAGQTRALPSVFSEKDSGRLSPRCFNRSMRPATVLRVW